MKIEKKKSPAGGETKQGDSQKDTGNIIAEVTQKGKVGGNHKYWVGVLYPENMIEDWETAIGDLVQLPYEYCQHDLDTDSQSEHRKDHIHLILVWPNTTTYKSALTVFNKLSAEGKKALNKIEPIVNIRHMHNYLIHDTETCRKQGKYQYPETARIAGNNFDIGSYEQISITDKRIMCQELCQCIIERQFINFTDFYEYALCTYDSSYFELMQTYSGLFERLTKGNYQKWQRGKIILPEDVDPTTGEVNSALYKGASMVDADEN